MGFFDIFNKGNKLKENFNLSEYFDPYYHSGDMYIASQHWVQKRVVIPGGPQGYMTIKIPAGIKTKEKLFAYLIENHNFKLPTFRLKSNEGYIWCLTYTGHTRYNPNRSSTSGYGSDDWFYLCEENGMYYLLMFTDNASFGTAWMITELLFEDYNYLIKAKADAWGAISNSAERTHQWVTNLLNINDVRRLLPTYSCCCGNLTDKHYSR